MVQSTPTVTNRVLGYGADAILDSSATLPSRLPSKSKGRKHWLLASKLTALLVLGRLVGIISRVPVLREALAAYEG